MHNPQLSDPDHPISAAISKITSKRKKTAEDRAEIGRLEFYGGIYLDEEGNVTVPVAAFRACFMEAGKITKKGLAVSRALVGVEQTTPLLYDGPRGVDALWEAGTFKSKLSVGVNNNRVMRVRPKFDPWEVSTSFFFNTAVLDLSEFTEIVEMSGVSSGLLDGRALGFGRFNAEIKEIAL